MNQSAIIPRSVAVDIRPENTERLRRFLRLKATNLKSTGVFESDDRQIEAVVNNQTGTEMLATVRESAGDLRHA